MKRKHIVFVENIVTGAFRPAILNTNELGPEVWKAKVFKSVKDLLDLPDEDLHDLAREMQCDVTTRQDTAELIWFRANQTQSIYKLTQEGVDNMGVPKKARKKVAKVKVEADRGRPSPLAGKKIYLKVEGNPRRAGTAGHKSFALIKDGMLVEDFVAKGGRLVDLRWDVEKKNVEVK